MRIKCICFMATLLLITLSLPIFANTDDYQKYKDNWLWYVESGAGNGTESCGSYHTRLGISTQSTDGYDGEQQIVRGDAPATYAATFHEQESTTGGWAGSGGFYREDYLAPFTPGQTKTWQLYVWATPNVPTDYSTMSIYLVNIIPYLRPEEYGFQLKLKLVSKPGSTSGGPGVGTAWDLDMPEFGISFPTYRTDNGLTGYHFELSATAVPEPSAIVALAWGLVGILTRTRKRRSL